MPRLSGKCHLYGVSQVVPCHKVASPDTYLLDKSVSNAGSDLDVPDDSNLLQADPNGKHQFNDELDDNVDKATGKLRVEKPQTTMHIKIPKTMIKMERENSVSRQPVVTGFSEAKSTMRPNGKGV